MRRYIGWSTVVLLVALPASLWLFSQAALQIGYLVVASGDETPVPVGVALFSFRNQSGILVSEAGVGATETLNSGRIFVDQRGTLTGVAFANPSAETVTADLVLRDSLGFQVGTAIQTLGSNRHLSRNVNQLFPGLPANFSGSLTFSVRNNRRLAAVTIRQGFNRQGEVLLATLPVIDLAAAAPTGAAAETLVFPHVGAGTVGGGIALATQVILVNRTGQTASGNIQLTASNGQPLALRLDGGAPVSSFGYELAPNGTFTAALSSDAGALQGYAVVMPDAGSPLPAGTAIFQYTDGTFPLSEAGVAAIPATQRARIFVDNAGTRTGFALAVPGGDSAEIQLDLLDRNGVLLEQEAVDIPAGGHTASFANDSFQLAPGFTGMLEISSSTPFVPITLKFTINERGGFVLTTLPVADLDRLPQATQVVFPQVGLGTIPGQGEFSTRLIFLNADLTRGLGGLLTFVGSDGAGLAIPLAGDVSSQFPYALPAGTARQYFPGLFADLAAIVLNEVEVTINQGNSFQLIPIAIDEEGNQRDDFVFDYQSLAPETIQVDQFGRLTALNRGFANITVQARGLLNQLVATGATVSQGGASFEVIGVQGDAAGQLYLSSASSHIVLVSDQVTSVPERYAGIQGQPGFVNALRLQSEFEEPSFMALDQGRARIYLSDSGNNAIRILPLGESLPVSTLAAGEGANDGSLAAATFRNPQGLALDTKDRLWVADRDNHTIRLIDLDAGTVSTLAGSAGNAGSVDGVGSAARFNQPTGITLEQEPLDEALSRGPDDPQPPITMLVVDAGSGQIRRVREDGLVETLAPGTRDASGTGIEPRTPARPFQFSNPSGIVSDDFGNIYVSEPANGRVRLLLRDGNIVPAAQEGSFGSPHQLTITTRGRVLVAESRRSVQEIRYAGPSIGEVTPARISNRGGQMVTVDGSNFARDTLVVFGGQVIRDRQVVSNRRIVFQAPALPSGLAVLTLHHRGGVDQTEVLVDATPLDQLDAGQITTIAGGSDGIGDGRFATNARFLLPFRAAADQSGNLYVADPIDHRVRVVDAITGIIRTVAGIGIRGFSADGTAARRAALNTPTSVAVGPSGEILIVDAGNNAVRSVDPETGLITTLIQNPLSRVPGAGSGPSQIWDVEADALGRIYIADANAHRILRFDPETEAVVVVAGTGVGGFNGDGLATAARLGVPQGIALDEDGNLLIADTGNHLVRRVALDTGLLETLSGAAQTPGFGGDGGAPVNALFSVPRDVFAEDSQHLLVADSGNQRIRLINLAANRIETVAGNGTAGFAGDGGRPTAARLNAPVATVVAAGRQVFVVDAANARIRAFSIERQIISTYAGSNGVSIGDGGLATGAALSFPAGVAFDSQQRLYIADSNHNRIRRVFEPGAGASLARWLNPQGAVGTTLEIETAVGDGVAGFRGDGGPPEQARLDHPLDVFVDADDQILVADSFNHVVRRIASQSPASFMLTGTTAGSGVIFTIAGTGQAGFAGDGGPANEAQLALPIGMTQDEDGNIYIADTANDRIRVIDLEGVIRTLVGPEQGLSQPEAVLFDGVGNLLIANTLRHQILRYNLSTGGTPIPIIGTGTAGFSGDGGPAARASLRNPNALALGLDGRLFIADSGNGRVRAVTLGPTNQVGNITTVAGSSGTGFSGDNGNALQARFDGLAGITLDPEGNLFICDFGNHRVRAVRGPIP